MRQIEKSLVIIPTVRNPGVLTDYINNAQLHRFDLSKLAFLIITEDFVNKSPYLQALKDSGVEGFVMNQRDRDRMFEERQLSEYSDLIPKRSHAETSFGLFYMYVNRSEYSNGIFIDDDTEPLDDVDYFSGHLSNLSYKGEIDCISSSSKWVNVLHHSFDKYHLYPRGYPYAAINESLSKRTTKASDVVASQGLWTNIPDLDAVRILMDGDLNGQSRTRLAKENYGPNFLVERGNYLTVCSMNLAFKSKAIPSFYQFMMDDNPWKIGRFDDIWSGVVLKKIADFMKWEIINCNPLCEHNKAARSTFKDLKSEVPGLESNEKFYKVIDSVSFEKTDIMDCSERIANKLMSDSDEFLQYSGKFFSRWVSLMRRIS